MSEKIDNVIPENQYVTGTVGQLLNVTLKGEINVPNPGPGMFVMEKYDESYLKVLQCGWYPEGELAPDAAAFRVIFMPLKAGETDVNFIVQPRAINPLNMPVTFHVTIHS